MGGLALALAFTGPGMPSGGWQTALSSWLQHLASVVRDALSWLPGWVLALVLASGFALLIRRARRTRRPVTEPATLEEHAREQRQ
jgi:TRAP-type C4-dicarboxylate transport system permease small subunit